MNERNECQTDEWIEERNWEMDEQQINKLMKEWLKEQMNEQIHN